MTYIHQCHHDKTDCCYAAINYCRRYKFKIKLRFCNKASAPKCKTVKPRYYQNNNRCRVSFQKKHIYKTLDLCFESINDGIL